MHMERALQSTLGYGCLCYLYPIFTEKDILRKESKNYKRVST